MTETPVVEAQAPPKKKLRKIKRRKGSGRQYFGVEAQESIVKYIDHLVGTPRKPHCGPLADTTLVGRITQGSNIEGEFAGALSGGVVGYVEEGHISGSTVRRVSGYLNIAAFGPGIDQTHLSGTFTGAFTGSFESDECRSIYEEGIRHPFETLVNSLIHTYKINFYGEDIYHVAAECVSFLYETLPKYNPNAKSKAFSYFNVCAKHWLLQRSDQLKKRRQRNSDIDDFAVAIQINEWDKPEYGRDLESLAEEKEFIPLLRAEFDRWVEEENLPPEEVHLVNTVRVLFDNAGDIETINRKVGYQLIREIGGFNSNELTKRMRSLKARYREFRQKYNDGLI